MTHGAVTAGNRVLVVGDANPDLVLRGDVVPRFGQVEQLLSAADLGIGGSAAITAHAFARLGRPVTLVAAVGADAFAAQLRAQLQQAGVDLRLTERADLPTGLSVILSRGDDRAILTLPGAIPTLSTEEIRAALAAIPARHVHVSSLYLQPALVHELNDVLQTAHRSGATTSLDTNDDPAGRWALPPVDHVDVLLPNRREVVALGGDSDPHVAARRLAARGPLVVVKDGANGAFAVDPSGAVTSVPPVATELVDSTGAGDTFNAAFLDGWLSGLRLPECLLRAASAGACSVSAAGGVAGQPTSEDLSPVPEGRA